MNYEHAYHAGSAADVFKHVVLIALLDFLKRKEKPMTYLDLYAGAGDYNLYEKGAQEWKDGVGKLKDKPLKNAYLKKYLELAHDLHAYPGSPKIAKKLCRKQDDIILIEKSDKVCRHLKKVFPNDKQVHIHSMDAELAIKGLLPPAIKRGLVFIDPPYEAPDEFEKLPYLLRTCLERFATASYLIWYPIKSRTLVNKFYENLKSKIDTEMLALECCPWPDDVPLRLNGSGLILVNPPFQFKEALSSLMPELLSHLKQDRGATQRVISLSP